MGYAGEFVSHEQAREREEKHEERERMARKEEIERMARKEEIERKKEEMEQHTKLELARIELEKAKIAAGQSKESNSSGFERPKVKLLQFVEGRDDMEAFLHRFQLTASAHKWNNKSCVSTRYLDSLPDPRCSVCMLWVQIAKTTKV
ncbi:hypothetical protein ElyMa_005496500 [Elysia marginata]|uniref:UBX domain-containing protein n=1 Tax=Elysia marginata TaxID=1093978 RepID=A0AAV4ETB9_9GAST|nr:hypothetical protein ElyMa_005496500 [Elysia marginata]